MSADPPHSSGAGTAVGDLTRLFDGPGEESLDDAQRERVKHARNAFKELEKLLKNTALYGASHQSTGRFRERYFELLSGALVDGASLEVVIGPYTLSVFDQVVYENQHPERNFVYKFYVDGVRRLIFEPGLRPAELDDFVDVCLVDWDDPALFEDDAVTLLWSKGFDHLVYTVAQTFDQDTKENEEHIFTVAGVVAEVRRAGALDAQATRTARAGRPPAHREVSLSGADLDRMEAVDFGMDAADVEALRSVLATNARETLEKFLEILFKVRLVETEPMAIDRIEQQFERMARLLLDKDRLGDLERLLRKLQRLRIADLPGAELGHTVSQTAARATAAVGRLFARWSTPAFIDPVVATIDDPRSPQVPSALAILLLLAPAAAVPTVQAIARMKRKDRRQLLVGQLPTYIGTRARSVAPLVGTVDGALAHELLRTLRALGDARAVSEAIRAGLNSADPAVRLEALGGIEPAEVPAVLELVFRALDDESKTMRNKAIHLLARVRSPAVHAHIMERIREGRHFSGLELDEKRRYFAVAALSAAPPEPGADPAGAPLTLATAFFFEQLEAAGLLSRKAQDELAHCAAVALALLVNRDAVPVFEREVRRRIRNEVVYSACRWALHHLSRDRQTRTRELYDLFFRGELTFAEATGATGG